MAAKLPQYATLQGEQQAHPLQQEDTYPLITPQQAGYPPPQAGYPAPQAGYPFQQAGYDPPQGYPQPSPQQSPSTVAIQQQPNSVNTVCVVYGESPVTTVCPHCQLTVVSTIHRVPGVKSCLCCLLLSFIGCCLYPFCSDECMDVVHCCPVCKNKIGVYECEI